jgi:hypothetical protein
MTCKFYGDYRGSSGVAPGGWRLDALAVAEELMVWVVAARSPGRPADLAEIFDEFDPAEPLDLFEAELDLVAQPAWREARR